MLVHFMEIKFEMIVDLQVWETGEQPFHVSNNAVFFKSSLVLSFHITQSWRFLFYCLICIIFFSIEHPLLRLCSDLKQWIHIGIKCDGCKEEPN